MTLIPSVLGRLAAPYQEVEAETRRLLATLPARDLAVVIRFFETMGAARVSGGVSTG